MGLITNEQDVKRPSAFLEYETGDSGNSLILRSHLYQVDFHFLNGINRSVLCAEGCLYCQAHYLLRREFNYMVNLNGQDGVLDVKYSVFFAIQKIGKAQKRDIRHMSWTVIKNGEGLKTKYTVSKDDNLAAEDIKRSQDELQANTDRLVEMMGKHEDNLRENYITYLKEIRDQEKPKIISKNVVNEATGETREVSTVEVGDEDTVDPDKIPF